MEKILNILNKLVSRYNIKENDVNEIQEALSEYEHGLDDEFDYKEDKEDKKEVKDDEKDEDCEK